MSKEKAISIGAEASIFSDGSRVTKQRFCKSYRLPELDAKLRKQRTKREAKVLRALQDIIPVPKLIPFSDKEDADVVLMRVFMEFINGPQLRDVLQPNNYTYYGKIIGEQLTTLHNVDIIHGDLTTSNMLVSEDNGKVYFIDFGLSFFSIKVEDKAVELHLLRQALESKHPELWSDLFAVILNVYKKKARDAKQIIKRFEQVEERGKNNKKKKK